MPVRARHVTSRALDFYSLGAEPTDRVPHFAQASHLPGDLIDSDPRSEAAARVERFAHALVEQHQGMMVTAVTHEITFGIAKAGKRSGIGDAAQGIVLVRNLEAKKIPVELDPFLHVNEVEAKMAEAANLKRLVELDSTDIESGPTWGHHSIPPGDVVSSRPISLQPRKSQCFKPARSAGDDCNGDGFSLGCSNFSSFSARPAREVSRFGHDDYERLYQLRGL